MHKSVDVAKLQEKLGGSCGVCCQKVSEAEVFVRGGIKDILISNQVCQPAKIDRLARLPKLGARTICCVDDINNVADLSAAAVKHGTEIECLVEIDCGAGRCGVTTTPDVLTIAKAIDAAPGLKFSGLQAYQGAMQHMDSYDDRKAKIDIAVTMVKDAVDALKAEGLDCDIVGGGGTGSYYFESASNVYNELQCGSYAFMDADYGRILDKDGKRIDQGEWENAFFILTSAFEALLMAEWIKPGTHIACMGTDTNGKQEVDSALMTMASVFTDELAQSTTIGEAQHAIASGDIKESDITPIGAVINGTHPGRRDADEITLFDGTGVGLQDLAVADRAANDALNNYAPVVVL